MSTVSHPEDTPRLDPTNSRRRRLALWIPLAVLPVVAGSLTLKRRWDEFREERIEHERNAADYTRVASVYHNTIEEYASAAKLAERAADGLTGDLAEAKRKDATARRRPETEARDQEAYYRKRAETERELAEAARRRW